MKPGTREPLFTFGEVLGAALCALVASALALGIAATLAAILGHLGVRLV